MKFLLLAFMLIADAATGQAPNLDNGKPSCPCISAPTWDTTPGEICPAAPDGSFQVLARYGDELVCHPGDFGIGCDEHDAVHDAACLAHPFLNDTDRLSYCDEAWCYVDMDVCKSNGTHTSFSTDLLITHGGTAPPFYSYTTCRGDASAWKESLVADGLKGKTLNVAFPVDNGPEHFMVHKGTEERICTNDEECQVLEDPELYDMRGLWIEYWDQIAALGGFTFSYAPVSQANIIKHGSRWTACAADVSDGLLDMCVGNFWPLPERIATTSANFLMPTSTDSFKLLHPPYEVAETGDRFWTFTKPFTSGVWAATVSTWFLAGATYYLLGAEEEMTRSPIESQGARSASAYRTLSSITKKMYVAAMEFLARPINFHGNKGVMAKNSIKIVKAFYAFFTLIMTSCYVGNMAVIQSRGQAIVPNNPLVACERNEIFTSEDSPHCRLCTHQMVLPLMEARFPNMLLFESESSSSLLTDYVDDKCTATMSDGLQFETYIEEHGDVICGSSQFDYTIYEVPITQPSNPSYINTLNYYIGQLKTDNRYEALAAEWIPSFENACKGEAAGTASTDNAVDTIDDDAFDLSELRGVFVIFVCACVLAIIVDYLDKHSRDALASFEEKAAEAARVHNFNVNAVQRATSNDPKGHKGGLAGSIKGFVGSVRRRSLGEEGGEGVSKVSPAE